MPNFTRGFYLPKIAAHNAVRVKLAKTRDVTITPSTLETTTSSTAVTRICLKFADVNLHTYHYAGNNPVKLVDPTGNFSVIFSQNRKVDEKIKKGQDLYSNLYLKYGETLNDLENPPMNREEVRKHEETLDSLYSVFEISRDAAEFAKVFLGMEDGSEEQRDFVVAENNLYQRLREYRSKSEKNRAEVKQLLKSAQMDAQEKYTSTKGRIEDRRRAAEAAGNNKIDDFLSERGF
jgi:hypothetical protein